MDEKRYHHGGLETELIEKGLQLLAREGYEGFSMRKLAAMCGVSHAAPYKHFKGRDEIILAVSQKISVEFSSALAEAAARHPDDPRQQVAELCVQYVAFMVEHPDYFRFVFMTKHGRPIGISATGIDLGGRQPMAIALKHAESWFRPKLGDGWRLRFLALWSMIHGYTLMLVSGTVEVAGDYRELVRSMLECCL